MTRTDQQICSTVTEVSASDDRIELMPLGEFRLGDRRGVQAMRIDNVQQVLADSLSRARGNELLIDFDHRSMAQQTLRDSRAAGWITGLEVEGERVMASVRWTPEGKRALQDRSFRFISPVFRNLPDGRVVGIDGAGLVNEPALPQLRQLASKEDDMDPLEKIAGLVGIAVDKPDDIVARVTALLGTETNLASIATAAGVEGDDVITQICSKLAAQAPDPAAFVPMSMFEGVQTQLASLQQAEQTRVVDAVLEKARADGKLTPDMEPWARQLASVDVTQFEGWAAVAPVRIPLGQRQLAGRLPPVKTDVLSDEERQMASLIGVPEDKFLATRNAAAKEV